MTTETRASCEAASTTLEVRTPLWKRLVRLLLIVTVVPYIGAALLMMFNQRRMIYHPARTQPLTTAAWGLDPATSRDVTLTTDDGLTLHGWLLTVDPLAGAESERTLLIYFPGNAAHRANRIDDLLAVTELSCDVLIFDYRGYAENPGSPSEKALKADAHAIWQFATGELKYPAGRIVLFGESLGGAVAVSLAETLSIEGTPPAALITEATFDSVPRLAHTIYPIFPFDLLVWDRWASIERIGRVTCPLLMFHGTADTTVPLQHGRRLFAAAPAESTSGVEKTFVEIDSADHNSLPLRLLQVEIHRLLRAISENSPPVADL